VPYFFFVNMAPLTNDDKILIKILRLEKGWSAVQVLRDFSARNWNRSTLWYLIKRIDTTGNIDRKKSVAVDDDFLELLQISNLSVVSYAVVHRI